MSEKSRNEQYADMERSSVGRSLIIALADCPTIVQRDVLRRVSDWLQSGGELADDYVFHQMLYAQRCRENTDEKDRMRCS